jgi:hypothetical protein
MSVQREPGNITAPLSKVAVALHPRASGAHRSDSPRTEWAQLAAGDASFATALRTSEPSARISDAMTYRGCRRRNIRGKAYHSPSNKQVTTMAAPIETSSLSDSFQAATAESAAIANARGMSAALISVVPSS